MGKLNNGITLFADIFFPLEMCKRWLSVNTGIVHNEVFLNTLVHEM